MAIQPGSYPYLRWILTRQSFPRVWQCILSALMLWIISSAIALQLLSYSPTIQQPVARFMWMFGIGTTISSLAIAAVFSVLLTLKEVQSERRQLLRLASYPSQNLIHDYTANTLYRIRPLIVLALGLSPTLAPGWMHFLIAQETARLCALKVRACQLADITLQPAQSAALVGISALISLTLVVTLVACCAMGVWMTLRWQEIGLALTTSLGLLALSLVPLLSFFVLYIDAALHIVIRYDSLLSIALTLPVIAVMGVIPHLLVTDTAWNRSRRWAWHRLASRGGLSDSDDSEPTDDPLSSILHTALIPFIAPIKHRISLLRVKRTRSMRGRSRHSPLTD